MSQDLALYVHWPWCKAKCPYCDFNSHAGTIREGDYIDALLREFSLFEQIWTRQPSQKHTEEAPAWRGVSLFFGGGTPSLMRPENIAILVQAAARIAPPRPDWEVTVECNPTSFASAAAARAFFEALKQAGVTRISIGIQGLNEEWLRFLGREHSVADALATLEAAQAVFTNVNADIIYGLPGQTVAEWTDFLAFLAARKLAHISAYQLTIEPNTRFYKDVKDKLWTPVDSDTEADFFEATRGVLAAHGYTNYEISNFCKPGLECQHNLHVWRYGAYAGFGAGAHGRLHDAKGHIYATRVLRHPDKYLEAARTDIRTVSQTVALTPVEALQEAAFAGLRLAEGWGMESALKRIYKASGEAALCLEEIAFLEEQGLLTRIQGRLALTPRGWPLLNSILQRILPAPTV